MEYCNRASIYDLGFGKTLGLFESELDELLEYAAAPCASDRFECFLATNCYDERQTFLLEQLNARWESKRDTATSVHCPQNPIPNQTCISDSGNVLSKPKPRVPVRVLGSSPWEVRESNA
eukprot:604151-Rhodomonas_salina.3